MKYIKSYMIFENYRDSFYDKLEDIQNIYNKNKQDLIKNTKLDVDEYMYHLTDEYLDDRYDSYIEDDDLSVWYHLRVNSNKINDFIKELEDATERIKDVLELEYKIATCVLLLKEDIPSAGGTEFNLGRDNNWWRSKQRISDLNTFLESGFFIDITKSYQVEEFIITINIL